MDKNFDPTFELVIDLRLFSQVNRTQALSALPLVSLRLGAQNSALQKHPPTAMGLIHARWPKFSKNSALLARSTNPENASHFPESRHWRLQREMGSTHFAF
jgi:hypothetical protein